jgi:Rrf2 family protein
MTRLSRQSAYAVLALLEIAGRTRDAGGTLVGETEIAELSGIEEETLAPILKTLVGAHILRRAEDRDGGYKLARSADETTLLSIVEAIDGEEEPQVVLPTRAAADEGAADNGPSLKPVSSIAASLLASKTIADLMS